MSGAVWANRTCFFHGFFIYTNYTDLSQRHQGQQTTITTALAQLHQGRQTNNDEGSRLCISSPQYVFILTMRKTGPNDARLRRLGQ